MAVLKSSGLYKTYQNDQTYIKAINDCNIEINAGEYVTINGEKDSGKTTLLRLLSGLERPTNGTIYINQHEISTYSDDKLAVMRRKHIGYIFQSGTLIPELTVHENIIIPSLLAGIKYDEVYYNELISRLHISEILTRRPEQLSDSQLSFVAIARALINRPDIILIDEPVDNMCQQLDKEILSFLLDMIYINQKVLIIVSNDPEINKNANHIIRLKNGTVIEDKRTNLKI